MKLATVTGLRLVLLVSGIWFGLRGDSASADNAITISARMDPPRWAILERQLIAENVPAAREVFVKYFDARGYLQCVVRWGANDGPDDAFEQFNRWPELHALGASDEIRQLFERGHEGLLRQYTEVRTTEVPIARDGMYYKEYVAQSDWTHHGEGMQLFNRMALSAPADATYQERARRFAGFYMGEDPEAPNYDAQFKIIRSMQNGSRGPMLRKATSIDWVGDPFDVKLFDAEHGESTFKQFLAHYEEYTDVVGDHFLNVAATTLPTNAYLLTGDEKYKRWIVDYMDAWLGRMKENGGIIPSHVGLDGKVGGADGKWWINPVTGLRDDRNRIGWPLAGFGNALLLTGNRKYVDAWRTMTAAVNAQARTESGRTQYPSMQDANGWYGWRDSPWDVGAVDVWYWSQRDEDLPRMNARRPLPTGSGTYVSLGTTGWIEFLSGGNPQYPEQALQWDRDLIGKRLTAMRADTTPADRRLADNMLDYNPVAVESLVQLMWGGLMPGRNGGLPNARLRYFDPVARRAGVPEDVATLVSGLSDTETSLTLVNLNATEARTVIGRAGRTGEHQLVSVTRGATTTEVDAPVLTVHLGPGAGEQVRLTMRRYANAPTALHPWQRPTAGREAIEAAPR